MKHGFINKNQQLRRKQATPPFSQDWSYLEGYVWGLAGAAQDLMDIRAVIYTSSDDRMRKLGLNKEPIEFILAKVDLEIGYGDLHNDERAVDMFGAQLLKHPDYKEKIRAAVQPAFAELLRSIDARRGAVLDTVLTSRESCDGSRSRRCR